MKHLWKKKNEKKWQKVTNCEKKVKKNYKLGQKNEKLVKKKTTKSHKLVRKKVTNLWEKSQTNERKWKTCEKIEKRD